LNMYNTFHYLKEYSVSIHTAEYIRIYKTNNTVIFSFMYYS